MKLPRVLSIALLTALPIFSAENPYPWPSEPQFLPVTAERIAASKAVDQISWRAYLVASEALATRGPKRLAFETPSLQKFEGPGIPGKHSRGLQLNAAKEWYASEAAKTFADRVVAYQSKAGAWTKGNDYTKPREEKPIAEHDVWSAGTLDNDATTWEMRFLARTLVAAPADAPEADRTRVAAWRTAFLDGLRYIFAAQYPNGGFPQIYPLAGGYHDAITFNDDAMVQAVELMRDIRDGKPEYAFVPAELVKETGPRVARALDCILAAQLRDASGRRTVWCQQHDALTLKPCAARNFEPVASCTNESASLVRFLMTIPNPSPEVVDAVKSAVAWFERTAQKDVAFTRTNGTNQLVERPGARPLWARMYELGTDKPIFGDRDRTVHFAFAELSSERRAGYAWYGTWPSAALEAYKTWPAREK